MTRTKSIPTCAVYLMMFPLIFSWCIPTLAQEAPAPSKQEPATTQGRVHVVAPAADVQYKLQALIIDAIPGDTIQFEEGVYHLQAQIDIAVDNITLRGRGSNKTILSFKNQAAGGQGIEATGNNLLIEGLAVEDTTGNAIKVVGARNVTFRDVRAEWTGPPTMNNGAYGLYPVQCQNVLMENSSAYGASDAGLYIGQCHNVVVRHCRAERNVAGIEIENTVGADVYENVATNNAGGLLVFDLPGLQVKNGRNVRVFNNHVYENNHVNFADPGGIVATVPSGTGVMLMATDAVEIFNNKIENNQTIGILVVSFLATSRKVNDPEYDPTPHGTWIRDNTITGSGTNPQGDIGNSLKAVLGKRFPDILWDGVLQPGADGPPFQLLRNGDATFVNFKFKELSPENLLGGKYSADRDIANVTGELASLPPIELVAHDAPTYVLSDAVQVYRSLPKQLSEYGLFEGPLEDHKPAEGILQYDLNVELFSDYADKVRLIKLPQDEKMEYRDSGVFEFPVGTIIAKTFAYWNDRRDATQGRRILETRIELLRDTGWYGASYVWNDEQTEATLVLGGSDTQVAWIDEEGAEQETRYQIPNANQCITCHSQDKTFVPIGPIARNLNRPFVDHVARNQASATKTQLISMRQPSSTNQLEHWVSLEVLSGLPDANEKIPEWPHLSDPESGTVETRARAWLDVNCAHCHSPGGSARTSGVDLRWDQADLSKAGKWKTPVAAGPGSGGRKFTIVPGKPDESILMYRLESDDPKALMPNVGRTMVYDRGVELVRQWIASLPIED